MLLVRSLFLISMLAACLFLATPFNRPTASGAGLATGKEGEAKLKKQLVGKWKHEKDENIIILEFTKDRVTFSNEKPNFSGQGDYAVLDGKTLELPGDKGAEDKVTVDSISDDKLVISGGSSWKFKKTEFKRVHAKSSAD
jgi:uncharacterized protein (TIGR03066 family)